MDAPFPVPTIMATGVAKPSAQGQEITNTQIAAVRENSKVFPAIIHTIKATNAMLVELHNGLLKGQNYYGYSYTLERRAQ